MKAVLKKSKIMRHEMSETKEEPKGKESKADKMMDKALKRGQSTKKKGK